MSEKPEKEVPWPKTMEELAAYIEEMVVWPNKTEDSGEGYGRCVYAMSNAALAAFRYVAGRQDVTGFQASMAEMQFVSDSRGMKHGWMLLNADDLLYPQYDLRAKVDAWINTTETRLADAAKAKLAEDGSHAHPEVRKHWERIAALEPEKESDK